MAKGFFTKDEWYTYFDWNPDEHSKHEVPDEFLTRFDNALKELRKCLDDIRKHKENGEW